MSRRRTRRMPNLLPCGVAVLLMCSFCLAAEEHKIVLRAKKEPFESAQKITMHMDADPTLKIVIENNTGRPFHYRVFPGGKIQGLGFTLLWRGKIVARTNGFRTEQELRVLKPKEKVEQVIAFGMLHILPGPWRGPKWLRSGDYMARVELEQARPCAPDTPERIEENIRIIIE